MCLKDIQILQVFKYIGFFFAFGFSFDKSQEICKGFTQVSSSPNIFTNSNKITHIPRKYSESTLATTNVEESPGCVVHEINFHIIFRRKPNKKIRPFPRDVYQLTLSWVVFPHPLSYPHNHKSPCVCARYCLSSFRKPQSDLFNVPCICACVCVCGGVSVTLIFFYVLSKWWLQRGGRGWKTKEVARV